MRTAKEIENEIARYFAKEERAANAARTVADESSISFLDWCGSTTNAVKCGRMQCMRNLKGLCKRKICDNPFNKERYGYKSK